jgi:hypothetical protein
LRGPGFGAAEAARLPEHLRDAAVVIDAAASVVTA